MSAGDTIVARATAPGRAGVAVVRVSGPGTRAIVTAIAGTLPAPRRAVLRAGVRGSAEDVDGELVARPTIGLATAERG